MDLQGQRDLLLLSELDRDCGATQRTLAIKLGVALGLTNLYLKRLARKGYINITTVPRNRIRYLLTPQGFTEKSRLTYLYMEHSLTYYRDMRARLNEMVAAFDASHGQRVVIYGTSDLAELAYLSLRELNIDCVGFIDRSSRESFLSCPVFSPDRITGWQFDRVLITDLDHAAACEEQLVQSGVSREKVLRLGLPK
ncbi:MAG TPA: winged helix-turn-helix transcriptional regulator [Nitrospiraceae bacterium]|nr:winged helix-turn-helix transcriptional regulator [Nitrospiraceae bacterium]